MSVACRWYEQDIGPVIYRGADGDAEVNSTSILRAYLRRTDGHALVVVEDAPREHASAIFEVIRTLDDDPTVSFLLDSRTSEWHETNAIGSDARLEQYRRSGIETVSVPRFTQQECSQFVETFATLLDEEPRISGSELFSMLQEGDGGHSADGDSLPVGTALIIQQYLARRQQASTGDPAQSQPTALEETVERVYRQLTAADHDTTLDLAIASAALNAAGLAVTAEYLYALAPAEQFDDIDAGLAELQGTMLFEHTNPQVGMSKTYRTYHETWSTRFLEQVLADRSTSDVQARFGEYVSRLLSLADEPERREMIERHVEGSTSHLHRIEADPEGWAMALIKRLFEFGQTAAKLAPLFGSADAETIELPDVCAESVTIQTSYWRGCIYRIHGDFEQAEQEFERLTDLVSNASIEGDLTDESMAPGIEARDIETLVDDTEQETEASIWRDEWHATAQIQLGGVTRERGDLATATQRFENALHLYEELGDAHGEATAQKHLGVVALKRGEVNAGKEYLDRSLDTFQRLGDEHGEAETLSDLGICAQMRGDIETAMDRFERSLEIFRDIGDRRNEAKALGNLGTAANVQGDMAAAERYKQEALTVFREIGDRHGEASALGELALIAQKQGNLERAVSHTRESLRLFRAVGDRHGEGMSLNTLGEVRYEQGQDESAVECFETALEVFQQVGDTRSEAEVRVNLGQTARDRDDLAAALKQYERSAALFETVDDTQGRADLAHRIGDLRYRRGEPGLAQSWFETAAEGYLDSNDKRACDVIDRLVEIYGSNGQSEAAVDWCRQGEQFAGEAGLEEWQDEFRTRRQVLAETDA